MIKKLIAFFQMDTAKALKGLSKAQANLRKASANAERQAEAANRLVEKYTLRHDQALDKKARADRVSDRLEDLLA
jgi:hypothetical protein